MGIPDDTVYLPWQMSSCQHKPVPVVSCHLKILLTKLLIMSHCILIQTLSPSLTIFGNLELSIPINQALNNMYKTVDLVNHNLVNEAPELYKVVANISAFPLLILQHNCLYTESIFTSVFATYVQKFNCY